MVCWRNKVVETIDFNEASNQDDVMDTGEVNQNKKEDTMTHYQLIKCIHTLESPFGTEALLEQLIKILRSPSSDEEIKSHVGI